MQKHCKPGTSLAQTAYLSFLGLPLYHINRLYIYNYIYIYQLTPPEGCTNPHIIYITDIHLEHILELSYPPNVF